MTPADSAARKPHLRLTVYEPRWHGFAKWRAEWVEPQESVEIISPQHEGWVRRRIHNVVTQTYPLIPSRRTCKNLARRAAKEEIILAR